VPTSSALRRLAYPTCPLELHLPATDGAIGHARVLLDELLIAAGFEQDLDAVALVLIVGYEESASWLAKRYGRSKNLVPSLLPEGP
jgi:hypothetical protein